MILAATYSEKSMMAYDSHYDCRGPFDQQTYTPSFVRPT